MKNQCILQELANQSWNQFMSTHIIPKLNVCERNMLEDLRYDLIEKKDDPTVYVNCIKDIYVYFIDDNNIQYLLDSIHEVYWNLKSKYINQTSNSETECGESYEIYPIFYKKIGVIQ